MLKGINPLLNADVLRALRAMGHGDDLIIVDTNFPSDSVARQTRLGKLLRIDNTTAAEVVEAVLSVMPLDSFVDDSACRMEIVGSPEELTNAAASSSVSLDGMKVLDPQRYDRMDEMVEVMRRLWTGESHQSHRPFLKQSHADLGRNLIETIFYVRGLRSARRLIGRLFHVLFDSVRRHPQTSSSSNRPRRGRDVQSRSQ